MTSFSEKEKSNLSMRVLSANVLEADASKQWFEAWLQYEVSSSADKVWLDFDIVRASGAFDQASGVQGALAPGEPLAGIVEDRVTAPVRLDVVPGSNYQTWVAYSTFGDPSSGRLNNWIQPHSVPRATDGAPSRGYYVRLFNGDPLSGGTEITFTDGMTGTGSDKSVAWTFNFSAGVLLLSSLFATTLSSPDLYLMGFRYVGRTAQDAMGGASSLADLDDVDLTAPPTDGDGLVFDDASGKWKPQAGGAGAQALDDLTDVDLTLPIGTLQPGDLLVYDGTNWIPGLTALANLGDVDLDVAEPIAGDLLVFDGTNWVAGLSALANLGDVDLDAAEPIAGDLLVFDGTKWVAGLTALANLGDVDLDAVPPSNGNTLVYDASTQKWRPGSSGSGSGATNLDGLTDVDLSTPAEEGDGLFFDGAKWVAGIGSLLNLGDVDLETAAPVAGDLLVFDGTNWVAGLSAIANLGDVDLDVAEPIAGDLLVFDGTKWVAGLSALGNLGDVDLTTTPPLGSKDMFLAYDGFSDKWVATTLPTNVSSVSTFYSTNTVETIPDYPDTTDVYHVVLDRNKTIRLPNTTAFDQMAGVNIQSKLLTVRVAIQQTGSFTATFSVASGSSGQTIVWEGTATLAGSGKMTVFRFEKYNNSTVWMAKTDFHQS